MDGRYPGLYGKGRPHGDEAGLRGRATRAPVASRDLGEPEGHHGGQARAARGAEGGECLREVPLALDPEEVHAGAFLDGFLLLTLGSLLAVCPVSPRLRSGLLGAGVASALGDLLLPFLAFRLPGWAALRVGSFALLSASLLAFIVVVWLTFGRAGRRDA